MNFRKYVVQFALSLIVILIFSGIDYFIHSLSPEYDVPSYYFRNKIVFGTIAGFIFLTLTPSLNENRKSLAFSASVSILLQIRYFLEGYPINFVLEFLFIHFLILLPTSWLMFKLIQIAAHQNPRLG